MNREIAASDLRWFLRTAPGELGLRSNFAGMISSLSGGGRTSVAVQVDERKLQAAERARRIEVKLLACSEYNQHVLRVAYAESDNDMSLLALLVDDGDKGGRVRKKWEASETARPIAEWLLRLRDASKTDKARARVWVDLKGYGLNLLELALDDYGGR